ncbi:MAG: sugar transferase [Eubacteriaceae bacterium]
MENNIADFIDSYDEDIDINSEKISRMTSQDIKKDSQMYLFTKRVMDILLSMIGLIALSPVFIIVAILIKLEDPEGTIIFKHMRIGEKGNKFPCLKFRTMFVNAQEMLLTLTPEQITEFKETYKIKDDPRITKVGKILRKTSLDEFPQLINIIKGEMTLVGPRPIVEEELEFYGECEKIYKSVKPGLTGYWQVHGRSDTTYDQRVQMDVKYISERNLIMDMKLIIKTVTVLFGDKNAY